MRKIKTWIMLVIITTAAVLQSASAIAGQAANTQALDSLVTSQLTVAGENQNDFTIEPDYDPANRNGKALSQDITIKSDATTDQLKGAYSEIRIPKANYKEPKVSDVTPDGSFLTTEGITISSDDQDYILKFSYQSFGGKGQTFGNAFKVFARDDVLPQTTLQPIKQQIFKDGQAISTGNQIQLKYNPTFPQALGQDFLATVPTKDTQNNQLTKDTIIDKVGYGNSQWSGMPYVNLTPLNKIIDIRDYQIQVVLPEYLDFEKGVGEDKWQWDKASKTATLENPHYLHQFAQFYQFNFKALKGAPIDEKMPITFKIVTKDTQQTLVEAKKFSITLQANAQDVCGEGSGNVSVLGEKDNLYWTSNYFKPATKIDVMSLIYPANPTRNRIDPTKNIASKVSDFDFMPKPNVRVENEQNKTVLNGDALTYTAVYLRNFEIERKYSGDYVKIDQAVNALIDKLELNQNIITVTYQDGTTSSLEDVDFKNRDWVTFNENRKPITKVNVKFKKAATWQSDDDSAYCYFTFSDARKEINTDMRAKMQKEPQENYYLFDMDWHVNYQDCEKLTDEDSETGQISKIVPKIVNQTDANGKPAGLEFGEKGGLLTNQETTATASFDRYNAEMLKDNSLKNAKVVYLFEQGVELGSEVEKIDNLKNVTFDPNYRDTGKVAIIGDVALPARKKGQSVGEFDKQNDTLSFTVPIKATALLGEGKSVKGEAFLVFDNNTTDYDYNKTAEKGYQVESRQDDNGVTRNTYGLYEATDNPDAFVYATGSFQYIPNKSLVAIKMVSEHNKNIWMKDTGNKVNADKRQFDYQLRISNFTDDNNLRNIDSIDVLPFKGDTKILATDKTRGSQFNVGLTGPAQIIEPTENKDLTIEYATDKPQKGFDANLNADWQTADQVKDWSKVTMLHLTSDAQYVLNVKQSIKVIVPFEVSGLDWQTSMMAANTFATKADIVNGGAITPVESDSAIIRTAGDKPITPMDQGEVTIQKIDAEIPDLVLAGAEFQLTKTDDSQSYMGTTDNQGKLNFTEVPIGDYTLQEIKAPKGYKLDSTVHQLTVKKDQTTQLTLKNTFDNTQKLGNIEINKINEAKQPLADAEFKIVDANDKTVATAKTDKSGVARVQALEYGQYQVIETKAPTGYQLDKTPQKVTVDQDNRLVKLTIENQKIPEVKLGKIEILKVDQADHKKILKDAEFEIQDSNGKKVAQGQTDKDGQLVFEDVKTGDYQVIETKAPTGYQLDKTPQKVTVDQDNRLVKLTIENKKIPEAKLGKIEILKVDQADHQKVLAGVAFELLDSNGKKVAQGQTDKNGQLVFDQLSADNYTLVETKPLAGYENIADQAITLKTSQVLKLTVKNKQTADNNDNTNDNDGNNNNDHNDGSDNSDNSGNSGNSNDSNTNDNQSGNKTDNDPTTQKPMDKPDHKTLLPQTDETTADLMTVLGALSLMSLALIYYKKR